MLTFLLKKTLFNYLEKFIFVLIANCLTLLAVYFTFLTIQVISANYIIPLIFLYIWQNVLCLIYGYFLNTANFKQLFSKNFGRKIVWVFFFSLINLVFLIIGGQAVVYYLQYDNFIINAAGLLCCWLILTWLIAGLFFIPLVIKLNKGFKYCIKQSFLLFFNNIFLVIVFSFIFLILVITTPLLILGVGFLFILLNNLTDLLLLKQKFLCSNHKDKMNWEKLLKAEDLKLGERSFKEIIFPWR